MVWDLGAAMRKKEEFESARLMDFEFRQRARATKLLAAALGLDAEALAAETATHDAQGILDLAAERSGRDMDEIRATFDRCNAEARAQLISERGDPTPYKLG